jgi:hypothetical protein
MIEEMGRRPHRTFLLADDNRDDRRRMSDLVASASASASRPD